MMKRIVGALILGAAISTLVPTHAAEPLPITDTHLHYSHDAWEVFPTEAAIALLREAGLKRAFVSSSSDEGTQRLYKAAPDLVVPVLRPYRRRGELYSWMHDDARVAMLTELLARNSYAGIGEFHAYGDDIKTDVLKGVIALAKQYDIFLHAHSDAAAVDLIFEQNPTAGVLWAHAGFVLPEDIAAMLRKHRNLWADLALRSEQGYQGKIQPEWRALFEEFPDRIMVGTDTYTPERWPYVVAHAGWSREWLQDLPQDIAENIAWRNAERLLAAKR
jgi:predicted TIM-barrel fold metal-dependent hydrolase